MGIILFIIFITLVFCLVVANFRVGKISKVVKLFRAVTIIFTISIFAYWFFERSVTQFVNGAVAVQIVNKLPQPIDFYLIKIDKSATDRIYSTTHLGKIRQDHYRLEYLNMQNSDEFWVSGFLGKKNMVYFSQHSVPNKNMDQIIEVNNYINQSLKLSDIAKNSIENYQNDNMSLGIWATLDLLLLFLNIILVVRRR